MQDVLSLMTALDVSATVPMSVDITVMNDGCHHNEFFARNQSGRLQNTLLGPVTLVNDGINLVFTFDSVGSQP